MFKLYVEQWNQPEIFAGDFQSEEEARNHARAYKLQDARTKFRIEPAEGEE